MSTKKVTGNTKDAIIIYKTINETHVCISDMLD